MNKKLNFALLLIAMSLLFISSISCNKQQDPVLEIKTPEYGLKLSTKALIGVNNATDRLQNFLSEVDLEKLLDKNTNVNNKIEVRDIISTYKQDGFESYVAILYSNDKFIGQIIYVNRLRDNFSAGLFSDWTKVDRGQGNVKISSINGEYISTMSLKKDGSHIFWKITDVGIPGTEIVLNKKESIWHCTKRVYRTAMEACDKDPECKHRCDLANIAGGLCSAATASAALISCIKNH